MFVKKRMRYEGRVANEATLMIRGGKAPERFGAFFVY